jgi:hypothetical protein
MAWKLSAVLVFAGSFGITDGFFWLSAVVMKKKGDII